MPRVNKYENDTTLNAGDKFFGTKKETGESANYTLSSVTNYILGLGGDRKVPVEGQKDLTTFTVVEDEATRYINTTTGTSVLMNRDVVATYIYEKNGDIWDEIIPSEGFNVWDLEVDKNFYFNGATWVRDVGDSAYEVAVAAGFVGDETAWLASLVGADGALETAASIKTKYESNVDTNAFTDAEKTLLSNQSGVNSGDQVVPTALADLSEDATHRVVTDTEKATWNAKQDALVSATNIKTINGESILGSGDVEVAGTGGGTPTTITYFTGVSSEDNNKADLLPTKNLFNKNTVTIGKYLSNTTGLESVNATYDITDFIKVSPGQELYFNGSGSRFIADFDIDGLFVAGGSGSQTNTYTVPADVYSIRASIFHAELDTLQIETGTSETAYEAYSLAVPDTQLNLTEYIKSSELTTALAGQVPVLTYGSNIYDKDTIVGTDGKYVSYVTGTYSTSATYSATGKIPIPDGATEITLSFKHQIAFYDALGVYISGSNSTDSNKTQTVPALAAFVDCTIFNGTYDTFMVSVGASTPVVYTPYKEPIPKINQEVYTSDVIQDINLGATQAILYLPKEVCVSVGRTIEIYNKQIAWGIDFDSCTFVWSCAVGNSLKRKFSITGASVGTHVLTLTVYNQFNEVIATGTTSLKIAANSITTPFTVCTIGDSLSNSKPWYDEITTLGGGNITFVGTRGDTPYDSTHEGRSGATAAQYLTNWSYTFDTTGYDGIDGKPQAQNPFYNTGISNVDFDYYKSNYTQNPDVLVIWLGTNGILLDPSISANAIQTFIDRIRLSATGGATIPIFVVHTLLRPDQNGIGTAAGADGTYKNEEDKKVLNLQQELIDLLGAYSNLYFIPVASCHDSEYNFGDVATPVNPRASQTESYPNEATHPQNQGYLQIADIIYSSLIVNQ